ncbi:hypothetical protein [Streptomyces sp. Ncost-T10-10d]|uniref:hypothetical protein n=1 Tax=Streptomyces sp. Ncost-T10-10d TaxID=1839774 RepID=UPI00081D49DF|nr:hypothetical protein [Streptomyces sp. Ncost-T10-10d]SCF80762.1 hypothetical protein GA0115254_117424 [Streptomyces sp. Ncost-T10-10d]
MLARLPLAYLLLMAAFSTAALCLAVQRLTGARKATVAVFLASVACCLGLIAVGATQYQHWNARQMLVMYSFTLAGLLIGFIPSRKILLEYSDEWRRGVKREQYEYPSRYAGFVCASVVLMDFLAFILAT